MNQYEHLGACVIVLDPTKNKVLLGLRQNCYGAGQYGLPGGRLELTEKLEQTAVRELLEETGLVVKKLKWVAVVRELQEEKYNFIHFGFLCLDYEGKPTNQEPDKNAGWEWFEINKLPNNLIAGHRQVIEAFQHNPNSLIDLV